MVQILIIPKEQIIINYFEPIKLMYEYFTSSDDIPNFNGHGVWTDGTNLYTSFSGVDYKLDNGSWKRVSFDGLNNIDGLCVWTDGANTYYSNWQGSDQNKQYKIT